MNKLRVFLINLFNSLLAIGVLLGFLVGDYYFCQWLYEIHPALMIFMVLINGALLGVVIMYALAMLTWGQ